MGRKKLTERQLRLKRLVEKGIDRWGDGDYEEIVSPERGWDKHYQYLIYVNAKDFSDFWEAMDEIYGMYLLDDNYRFKVSLMPGGTMMLDLNEMVGGCDDVLDIWPRTERNMKP